MAGNPPPPGGAPVLQKPPGYRDHSMPTQPGLPQRPPQRKPLPPSFRPVDTRKRRRCSRCSCGRCFCYCLLIFLVILCIVGIAGAVFYLFFQPKVPSIYLQSLKIAKFKVSMKPDGTFLDASASANVQFTNSNSKIVYSYKQGDATFSAVDIDGNVDLGLGTFPGFLQGTKNSTVVKLSAHVKKAIIGDSVGSRLKSRFQSKDLMFLLEMKTKLGVRIRDGITVTFPAKIVCGEVSLKQIHRNTSPKCTMNVLKWIKLN